MLSRSMSIRGRAGLVVFIFVLIFIFTIFKFLDLSLNSKCSLSPRSNVISTSNTFYQVLNNTEDEDISLDDYSIWCLHMAHRLDNDQRLVQSPILQAPSFDLTKVHRLPYFYTYWKSSPLLPRRTSRCEHSLVMRLLSIVERICRIHKIAYMLSDGTLLGSLRHHDIIPWDTDTDIMIYIEDKDRFLDAVKQMNGTLLHHRILSNEKKKREYYKLFFKNTPSAGGYSWNFPFLDIFVYVKNETHLWKMGELDTSVETKYIFPLVMRPMGELWLPSPREPRQFFDFDPFDECKLHWWDHRKEKGQDVIKRKCKELQEYYPFVVQNNQSNSTEVLQINNTIIHTIIYK